MSFEADILVVEDSATQAMHLQVLLEDNGFAVRVARDGEAALAEIAKRQPSLVISDIIMPKMDGFELCKRLKSSPDTRAIPVVLVTALIDPSDVVNGLISGADNFITKPYQERYLLARVRQLLATAAERSKAGSAGLEPTPGNGTRAPQQQILDLLISTYEEGVRLNRELQSKHDELSMAHSLLGNLFHFTADLSGAQTEAEVIDTSLDQIMRFPDVESVFLLLGSGEPSARTWHLAGSRGSIEPRLLERCCSEPCPCVQLYSDAPPPKAINLAECPVLSNLDPSLEHATHATVPLSLGQGQAALLNVVRQQGQVWDEDSLDTLRSLGDQLEVALERARLLQNMEHLVGQRTEALNAEMEERLRAEDALRNSERMLRQILDTLTVGVLVADTRGNIILHNPEARRILGGANQPPVEDVQSYRASWSETGEPIVGDNLPIVRAVQSGESALNQMIDVVAADGVRKTILSSTVALRDANAVIIGAIAVIQDVTKQRRVDLDLRVRNSAIESSVNAIIITDFTNPDHPIVFANEAFSRITGYQSHEVIGRNCRFLQRDERDQPGLNDIRYALRKRVHGQALLRNYRKDGSLFWNDLRVAPVTDARGQVTHYVGVLNDVTESKQYQEQLEHQANYDTLTGLPNSNLLSERIEYAITHAKRQKSGFTLVFIDLDNFKYINDSLGHNVGDQLLQEVALRLKACVRDIDTVARQGGDEFVILLDQETCKDEINATLHRVLEAVAKAYVVQGMELFVTCSIGYCTYPEAGLDATTLLKNADAAMYHSKEHGRNRISSFTNEMNQLILRRVTLERELRHGIENGELQLYYQPQLDAISGRVVGLEALVRWHRQGEIMSPVEFIPVAEESGLILSIDEWVLNEACRQLRAWQLEGLPAVTVSVNLSARQIQDADCLALVDAALARSQLDARFLKLEVTESMLMRNTHVALQTMRSLRDRGIQLSIDDFGTGYSSLSYLKRFPFGQLKIDKQFVQDIISDPEDAAVTRAIINLGHILGIKVVAEGVETLEQLAFLTDSGCDLTQGFLYSPPLPPDACAHFLEQDQPWERMLSTLEDEESRTLLIVDEDPSSLRALTRELQREGYRILTTVHPEIGFRMLAQHKIHVVLVAQAMREMSGVDFLRRVKAIYPSTIRVLLSGSNDINSVLGAINEGAVFRLITQPWGAEHLIDNLRHAFHESDLVRENRILRDQVDALRQSLADSK